MKETILLLFLAGLSVPAVSQEMPKDTRDLSLDSLLSMKISSASKHWETASAAPASVTIVPSEDIEKFGFRTLADVLASVRSFYTSYDRNYSYVGVRGFSRPTDYNDRILLLLNGHTMNEGFYGTSPFGTDFALDLNSVDRIEIVRGPGSALYGSGALFAVVNVVTRTGRSFDRTQVSIDGGSFGAVRGSILAGKEIGDGVDAMVSAQWSHVTGQDLYFKALDAPATNGGLARGLDWDRFYGVFTSLSYRKWSLQALMSVREKGIPTGAFGTVFNDPRAKTLDRFGMIDVAFHDDVAHDKNILLRGYVDDYYYAGAYPYVLLQQEETTARRIGAELQLRWDLASNHRLISGMEYTRLPRADFHSWDERATYFDHNFPYSLFSFYVEDEYEVTHSLAVSLGVRRDAHSASGGVLSPRGAVVFHAGQATTLKLMYGQAFRSPSQYESNYQDPLSNFKISGPLGQEKIQTMEFVWEQRVGDEYFVTLSLYHNRIDDLIDQVIDPADSMLQFRNIRSVRAFGAECELIARLRSGLTGYASYAHQYTADPATGDVLTNSPSDLLKAGLTYEPSDYLQMAMDAGFESGRLTVQGTSTDPFFLANLRLALHLARTRDTAEPGLLERLQLSVFIGNLFNTQYATPGGFEHVQASIPQDRRSYRFTLALTL